SNAWSARLVSARSAEGASGAAIVGAAGASNPRSPPVASFGADAGAASVVPNATDRSKVRERGPLIDSDTSSSAASDPMIEMAAYHPPRRRPVPVAPSDSPAAP